MPEAKTADNGMINNPMVIATLVESKITAYKRRGTFLTLITVLLICVALYNPVFYLFSGSGSLLSDFFKEGYKASFSILTTIAGFVCQGFHFGNKTKIKTYHVVFLLLPNYSQIEDPLQKRIIEKVVDSLLNEIK